MIELTTELQRKLVKQIEFYFSDSNLTFDKFLIEQIKKNPEGWVPLATIASFSRVKALTLDPESIRAAISSGSTFLQLEQDSEGRWMIRRASPLDSTASKDSFKSSLYVKGFSQSATLEDLETYFEKLDSPVKILAIRMRRFPGGSKAFKGSVFLELEDENAAKAFCSLDLKSPHSPQQSLYICTKSDYFASKNKRKTDFKKSKKPFNGKKVKGSKEQQQQQQQQQEHNEVPLQPPPPPSQQEQQLSNDSNATDKH